jgi:hypothetical protein
MDTQESMLGTRSIKLLLQGLVGSCCPSQKAINGELVNISHLVKPSYYEKAFKDLKAAHGDDHAKGRAFEKKVASAHNNLPQRVCKMFTEICP